MSDPIQVETRATGLHDILREFGAVVVPGVYTADEIAEARKTVLEHRHLMHNTRSTPSSRHLAGFHRFPRLEGLHRLITAQPVLRAHMEALCGAEVRTIGLSDITVNRSQQWHKDLLRGEFTDVLDHATPCAAWHGNVFKVIVYLQDSQSLKILPGSHRQDICLENDTHAIPMEGTEVTTLSARAGDAVIIDICTTHRGSPESAFAGEEAERDPKILVSTVFGNPASALTRRMEVGNMKRMAAWMERHAHH